MSVPLILSCVKIALLGEAIGELFFLWRVMKGIEITQMEIDNIKR